MNEPRPSNEDMFMWALPIFDYVDDFNSRNTRLKINPYSSHVMHFVHLDFVPTDKPPHLIENILHVAATYRDEKYQLYGNYYLHPNPVLEERVNKEKAHRVSRNIFGENAGFTDEEHANSCVVTPSPLPHLVHRYLKFSGLNDFSRSELYFKPVVIDDFAANTLEADLRRFLYLVSKEV
jgi:hypothetical protein